nr:AMP-binding protein [Micromonospora sp. WMMA1996]
MVGYHGLPEATAAALRDGWYRTGDLARRDGDGNLFVTGRHRELIIRVGRRCTRSRWRTCCGPCPASPTWR